MGSIKAPEGFVKHTGSQHWDSAINVSSSSSMSGTMQISDMGDRIIFSNCLLHITLSFLGAEDNSSSTSLKSVS